MIRVLATATHTLPMRLRMPFRYGIATLTELPHLFVQAQVEVNGQVVTGVAADGLAPKWFTKQPQTTLAQDTAELLDVIAAACCFAERAAPAATLFALWQAIYAEQAAWGQAKGYPPLLWLSGLASTADEGHYFEAYGYNLTFNRRMHFGQAAEYWDSGLVVLD